MPLNVSLMSGVPGSAIIASQHGRVAIPPTPKSQTVTARPRIQPAYSGELEILLDWGFMVVVRYKNSIEYSFMNSYGFM